MRKRPNIFVVGPEASGAGFFGRKNILDKIKEDIIENAKTFDNEGTKNLTMSIVGLNRIGKSSIVQKFIHDTLSKKDDILVVLMGLDTFMDSEKRIGVPDPADQFWFRLVKKLRNEIKTKAPNLPKELMDDIDKLDKRRFDVNVDINDFRDDLVDFFKNLDEKSQYRVILILDEFDAAETLFKGQESNFATLRTIANSADNSVTMITVSRRSLEKIAQDKNGVSTFHGVFYPRHIPPFENDEVEMMYRALGKYGIFLDEDEKLQKKLVYYAGNHPYLLSIYLYNLVEQSIECDETSATDVDRIKVENIPLIHEYYRSAIERFEQDGFIDQIYGIVVGPRVSIKEDDVRALKARGYLCGDGDSDRYYCISHDFAEYLRYNYKPSIPLWYAIMHSEKIIRLFVRKVYPRLDEYVYTESDSWAERQKLQNNLLSTYNLSIDWKVMEKFIKSEIEYNKNATLCDVFSLGFMIDVIKTNWDKFVDYFGKNGWKELNEWEKYFNILKRVRTPLAHSKPEYITAAEEKLAAEACELIAELCPEIPRDKPDNGTDMQIEMAMEV